MKKYLPILVALFLINCVFQLAAQNDDDVLPLILSNLWKLDAQNRQLQKQIGILEENPIGSSLMGQPQTPIEEAYSQYCDKLANNSSESNEEFPSLTLLQIQNNLLAALNSTQIFQKAAAQFSSNSLIESTQKLFFMPQNDPPFNSLFCQFSMDSANSFSLHRNQQKLADKLLETIPDENTLLIRLRGDGGNVAKRRILLGPSVQFEFTAIALCAIFGGNNNGKLEYAAGWKHCWASIEDGKMLRIAMKTTQMNGNEKIVAYFPRITGGGRHENRRKPKPPKPNPNPELQKLVEQLWTKDVDRVEPGTINLNWQGKLKMGQVEDISPDPLFTNVNETFLQKPIYAALVEMYKEKDFHEQVCEEEPPMSPQRREKFAKLWGIIVGSEVFKTAYEYLDKLNKTGGNFDGFCAKMFDFWFGTYSRCKQHHNNKNNNNGEPPLGSSGFEHVFSGEWRQGIVEGHHNWIRFYLQEKAGEINYHGYFGHQPENYIGTFQYKWKGFLKKIGGFFFQTSPAFDFSLFSVCVLTQPGNEHCQFELFQSKLFVTSFRQPCQNGSSCVATTYPGAWY